MFAGSVLKMEELASIMEKAVLIQEICQDAKPKADFMKVMLLGAPVHAEQEVWMWRREVLSSKLKLHEAIAQDPQDEVRNTWHQQHSTFSHDMHMGHLYFAGQNLYHASRHEHMSHLECILVTQTS